VADLDGSAWKRADGIITQASSPGLGSTVRYSLLAKWNIGAVGTFNLESIKPHRMFEDSDAAEVTTPAPPGSPCTVTVAPDGTMRMFCLEEFGVEDCE
jgi:hypothetical protein